jgi:4-amino-4-deoxy-L-arabinose transferase-like glycosyltransferase
MEDHLSTQTGPTEPSLPGSPLPWARIDWCLFALLLLLAAGIRLWQLTHTEVAARDSIGFIRIAWQLNQKPFSEWPDVLKQAEQHPVYPLAIWAVSVPLRHLVEGPEADRMRLSAQMASALAAVLLVLPLFSLGRMLFDRRVGVGAALLVQCLPVSGRILADGLSEATFLLFAASGLYWSVRALRRSGGPWSFALTGFFGGLAYLTRPEGALIVAATGLVLLAGQAVHAWRRSTRELVQCGAVLSVSALLLALPYIALTGHLTVKPAGQQVIKNRFAALLPSQAETRFTVGPVLLAKYEVFTMDRAERFWWGMGTLGQELIQGSFYVGWLAALLGIWFYREQTRREPGAWMMLLLSLGVAFALWRVAVVVGYLSDRHTLLILLCGSFWAMAGLVALGEWLAREFPAYWSWSGSHAGLVLPLLFALSALPKTLQPLHAHRSGFRAAGLWLAEHSLPVDPVTDPLCWSHYYAGRVFLEGTRCTRPPDHHLHEYVVIEEAGNRHPRIPTYDEALKKAARGTEVFRCAAHRGQKTGSVVIYQMEEALP